MSAWASLNTFRHQLNPIRVRYRGHGHEQHRVDLLLMIMSKLEMSYRMSVVDLHAGKWYVGIGKVQIRCPPDNLIAPRACIGRGRSAVDPMTARNPANRDGRRVVQ